ncbi:MAG: creatininase family protein [Anaerolineae bacterium]
MKVRWEEMLPHEFVEARDRRPVCYLAYGLAEPHGAYNALGLDWLKAQALVERAANRCGGIVAPPLAWHIQELPAFHDDGRGRGWLVDAGVRQPLASSIPADLFYRLMLYQVRALDARGFRAAILVTGHYGGVERVMRRLCEYYTRRSGSPLRLAALADWECIASELPYRGDHAGVCETSQLMALRPGLTDLERRTASAELGERFAAGVDFERGPLPSAELGQRIVESQVAGLGALAERLLAEYTPRSAWRAPDLDATEEIWRGFERLTRKYWELRYEQLGTANWLQIPGWDELGE